MQWAFKKQSGFTIVELLIVIVVIAILAAITIVAYNGIQQRAKASVVASAAASVGKKVALYAVDNGDVYPDESTYQSTLALPAELPTSTYDYYVSDDKKSYCLSVTDTTKVPEVAYATTNKSAAAVAGRCVKNFALDPQLQAVSRTQWSSQTPSGNTIATEPNAGPGGESVFAVGTINPGALRIAFRGNTAQSVTAGDVYRMSYWLYSSVPINSVGVETNFGIGWRYSATDSVKVGWQRYSSTVTVPSGATSFSQSQLLTQSNVPAGASLKMTTAQITKGTALYSYATPSTDANWAWTGSANASPSFGPALPQ